MITPEEIYIKNLNKRVKVNSNKEIDYQHYLAIIDSIIEYSNIKVRELQRNKEAKQNIGTLVLSIDNASKLLIDFAETITYTIYESIIYGNSPKIVEDFLKRYNI